MDEAQNLADRVAIIAGGQIVAQGTPQTLAGRDAAPTEIRFRLPAEIGRDQLPQELAAALSDGADALPEDLVVLRSADAVPLLNRLTGWALEQRVELIALEVTRPSLEDVYLEVTSEDGA
jgi:ABC-2 type transport system ATP-binding protein